MNKLNELVKLEQDNAQKIRKQFKDAVAEAVKVIFDSNPSLELLSWRQYTAYFNDGDTCEFSIPFGVEIEAGSEPSEFLDLVGHLESALVKMKTYLMWAYDDHVEVCFFREGDEIRHEVKEYSDHD